MKICFPIAENQGLDSEVYGHFGSAPQFIIVDTDTREVCGIHNKDKSIRRKTCATLKALGGQDVDAIVVGGIGAGALMGLNRAGLQVYQARGSTLVIVFVVPAQTELPVLTPEQTCGGHSHGHNGGCHH